MYQKLGISSETVKLIQECEQKLEKNFKKIDEQEDLFSLKVLNAFHKHKISEVHFNMTTGYGYGDIGRDTIEKVFAEVLGAEDALVRSQFISGTHALTVALFAYLRPGDLLLSISGTPYDTIHEVIGIRENASSLKSFGVLYDEIDLVNDDFDDEKILSYLKENPGKMIEIQRSRGDSTRKSLGIQKVERIIKKIKKQSPNTIIMVDNC
ncbi:MAG: methionine gamma-lyase family protein, partial [Bacilli bacterium]|nr:methionine gamma-lyase family protein [Bacilli bacterium]